VPKDPLHSLCSGNLNEKNRSYSSSFLLKDGIDKASSNSKVKQQVVGNKTPSFDMPKFRLLATLHSFITQQHTWKQKCMAILAKPNGAWGWR
jgi:hypothetical protein